jgi:triosephosphate isomerase
LEDKMALKYIFVNLKRFDVPPEYGGVNRLAQPDKWAGEIISGIRAGLEKYPMEQVSFTFFFPEAHIAQAAAAKAGLPFAIGCQGVYWDDIAHGGNFGAFTSSRPASAMAALGCKAAIIGHCEERRALTAVLAEGGVTGETAAHAVNRLLGKEIAAAGARDLEVLYCIGEKAEEQEHWQDVLSAQIEAGLSAAPDKKIVIGYEPVWAIGPGKTPPDHAYIGKIARFIKEKTGLPVVYGGGLKTDNAPMLASIPEIDGGLIALTRFSGEIGFYPYEFLQIVNLYLKG